MRSGGGFAKIREGKVGARRAVPLLYWFAGFPLRCNSKNYEWNRWNNPYLAGQHCTTRPHNKGRQSSCWTIEISLGGFQCRRLFDHRHRRQDASQIDRKLVLHTSASTAAITSCISVHSAGSWTIRNSSPFRCE